MELSIRYPLAPKARSLATSLVMDAFGIQFDAGEHIVCDNLQLDIQPGHIVLFTGPSGSGKSSLLRAACSHLQQAGHRLIDVHALDLPDRPLVDALPLEVKPALDLLSACGLGEAQLLLRTPAELSEGQRYRFRLALGIAQLLHRPPDIPGWLVADEFTATLDRTLAKVISFNISRLARRHQIGCLLATTHDDIEADLSPDLCIKPDLDGHIAVLPSLPREEASGVRGSSRRISFFPSVSSGRAPVLTGPHLPVGIIAATPSAWSAVSRCSGMAHDLSASASLPPRPAASPCATASSDSAIPPLPSL